jgi:hypothetical protein
MQGLRSLFCLNLAQVKNLLSLRSQWNRAMVFSGSVNQQVCARCCEGLGLRVIGGFWEEQVRLYSHGMQDV